jgi:hypothetical protein
MAPPTSTRLVLRQRIARRLYPNVYPVVSASTGGGSVSTIVDSLLHPGIDGRDVMRSWIYIAEKAGSGPEIGEISRVYSVDFSNTAGTSTLILSPDLSATAETSMDYEIHYKYHPAIIHRRIDEVLGMFQAPVIVPLSLIADGDMETSGTSNWTASGTGGTPTLAKNTSTVFHSRQSLSITNDGSTTVGYAKSDSVALPPNTTVLVAADVFITSGDSARLSLFASNLTAGTFALVGTAARSDEAGWMHFEFTATTGATDEWVQLWLESQAASDVTYWDNAILLPVNQTNIDIPATIELSSEAKSLFYFPRGSGITGTNNVTNYRLSEQPKRFWSHFTLERDETAVVPYRIESIQRPISSVLWLDGMIDYPAFAGASEALLDADTTACPADLVVEFVYALFLEDMADEARIKGDFEGYREFRAEASITRNDVIRAYRDFFTFKGIVIGASQGGV